MQKLNLHNFLMSYYGEDNHVLNYVQNVVKPSENGPWIAGGSVRRAVANEPQTSDFDIFFRTQEQFNNLVDVLKDEYDAKRSRSTEHHVTYAVKTSDGNDLEIQLINFQYFDNIEELLDFFDYTICQFAIDGTGYFYCGSTSLWDLARKRIVINKITFAVSSLRRLIKYANQGYTACGGTLQTFIESIMILAAEDRLNMDIKYVD